MALFSPIAPDPVDGGMIDARRQEGTESLELAHDWRALEPAAQELDDDILGRALIGDMPPGKGQHLRTIPLIQQRDGLRLSLAQGPQELFVAFRCNG